MPSLYERVKHRYMRNGVPVIEVFGVSGHGNTLSRDEQKAMFEGLKHCRINFPNNYCKVQVGEVLVEVNQMVHYAPHSDINGYDTKSRQEFAAEVTGNPFSGNPENKSINGWICDPWIRRDWDMFKEAK